jgi:sugar phosphate isomerase/epimerase
MIMPFKYTGFADEASKSIDGQIAATKAAGWNSIELRLVGNGHYTALSDDEFDETMSRFAAADITITGYGGAIANWSRPITTDFQIDIDELHTTIPRMQKYGVKLLRIMSYPNVADSPWPEAEWKAEVFRRLRELATIAEDGGILLAHENCNGYGGIGAAQSIEMLEAVDSPALALIFDSGNNTLHDNDNEATWRFWEGCKDHVVHIHIKAGKPGEDGAWITCYPDEDPVQLRILTDLQVRGYDGWVSIEPHLAAQIHAGINVVDDEAATQIYVEYARRLENLGGSL